MFLFSMSAFASWGGAPFANGSFDDPILFGSEEQFDDFLTANPPNESVQIFFYQVADGIEPIRASCDYFTFAEIIFKYNNVVVSDGIFVLKITEVLNSNTPPQGWGAFWVEVPVPDEFVNIGSSHGMYHERLTVPVGDFGYDIFVTFEPPLSLQFGRNYVQIRERRHIYLRMPNGETTRVELPLSSTHNNLGLLDLPTGYTFNGYSQIYVYAYWIQFWYWAGVDLGDWEDGDILDVEFDWRPSFPKIPMFRSGTIVELDSPVATPTATPANRTFTNSVNVTLSTETDGATIHFTTDGSEPTTTSTPFTAPIALTATTTIRAIAVADGMEDSEELYVRFTRQTGGGNIGDIDTTPIGSPNGNDDPTPWEENPFADVSSNDWFYNYVRFAYINDLMQGISATQFAPNSPTTRAMAVTILWRLAGEPTANVDNQFTDVAIGTWYATAVSWAAENGIVLGVSETKFAPNAEITREQMATILWRFEGSLNADVTLQFSDTETVSYWAVNAVSWAVDNEILRLRANETIAPQALATRAEIAFAMARIAD